MLSRAVIHTEPYYVVVVSTMQQIYNTYIVVAASDDEDERERAANPTELKDTREKTAKIV